MKFKFETKFFQKPSRVVLLGTSGIISKNLQLKLKKNKVKFIKFGRKNLNLKSKFSIKILKKKIKENDFVIFISAEAPVKNIKMLNNNLKICNNVAKALSKISFKKIMYVSSDAVYSDIRGKINETSKTVPNSLHGKMHIRREKILLKKFKNICILRPTLIYGLKDTHKGYGPNQFLQLAINKKNIKIFGNGEERRDHVYIKDVIKIMIKCIFMNASGILNIASGKVTSFKNIAAISNQITNNKKRILKIEGKGPMPHNGYRPFLIKKIKINFKDIKITSIKDGIKNYYLEIIR